MPPSADLIFVGLDVGDVGKRDLQPAPQRPELVLAFDFEHHPIAGLACMGLYAHVSKLPLEFLPPGRHCYDTGTGPTKTTTNC